MIYLSVPIPASWETFPYEKQSLTMPLQQENLAGCKLILSTLVLLFLLSSVYAQDSVSNPIRNSKTDTKGDFPYGNTDTPQAEKSRVRIAVISNVAGYALVLAGLNATWYSGNEHSKFHTFNDNREWLQADKAGHLYSAYIESRTNMELWRRTGIDRNKRIWLGGLGGAVYQTVIEILDGFSAEWGWSWGDFSANLLGSGTFIAQELAWDEQRIKLKFSFQPHQYEDPLLNYRADELFGKTFGERIIRDYNAQTYWASINLPSFFPNAKLPPWLSLAIGYGAEGMWGNMDNTAKGEDGDINFDRSDIKRYRQWYLSPDIDFTKIKTKKKGVRILFTVLSAFKIPAPGVEFSNGKFTLKSLQY